MLRLTVLLLLLANAAYFAWSQGLLAPWGIAPAQQSEPQRLEHQIKPQAVRILGSEEAGRLELAAAGPSSRTQECLQAGLFEELDRPRVIISKLVVVAVNIRYFHQGTGP